MSASRGTNLLSDLLQTTSDLRKRARWTFFMPGSFTDQKRTGQAHQRHVMMPPANLTIKCGVQALRETSVTRGYESEKEGLSQIGGFAVTRLPRGRPAQDPQQKQMITIKAAFPADMPREPLEKLATRGQLS